MIKIVKHSITLFKQLMKYGNGFLLSILHYLDFALCKVRLCNTRCVYIIDTNYDTVLIVYVVVICFKVIQYYFVALSSKHNALMKIFVFENCLYLMKFVEHYAI